MRPRDTRIQSLAGAAEGEATYYLVEDFHGFSTTVADHARAAQSEYGKRSQTMQMPVTTLRALCERHAPAEIDFLKIDVEGAEQAVLAGNDFKRFRPKVVVAEAVAPFTMAEASGAWEPLLAAARYRLALFDGLNRYYVAQEHAALMERLAAAPAAFDGVRQFRDFKPALGDAEHPDHGLARLLGDTDPVRLPLMDPETVAERLINGLDPTHLNRPAQPADIAAAHERLFGLPAPPGWAASLALPANATLRELYRNAVKTDAFRAACGRISASAAW